MTILSQGFSAFVMTLVATLCIQHQLLRAADAVPPATEVVQPPVKPWGPSRPISADSEPAIEVVAGPLQFTENQVLHNFTYAYGIIAADFDGDGDIDLTGADAEPNCNLYLLRNDGQGRFTHSYIQKYAGDQDQATRMERHAAGDMNGDGLLDIVIVHNLNWDIRWFEHPGIDAIDKPWKIHRISPPKGVPGSYDVAIADLDADGDLDVAASSWRYGNRFDWFENNGDGSKWTRHEFDSDLGETRTIDVGDFNGDGKPDLLGTARIGNVVMWYENSGNPLQDGWKKHVIDDQTVNPTHGHPVDLDGDGDLDVVMTYGLAGVLGNNSPDSHQVAWYENLGPAGKDDKWKKHVIAPSFPQGFEAVAGDLDGDGDVNVVATGWSSEGRIAWFENPGDPRGTWKMHTLKKLWPMANTVVLADVDNDGRLDIAACAEHGANEIRYWHNDGARKEQ